MEQSSQQEAAPSALSLLPRNLRHKKAVEGLREVYFANKQLRVVPDMRQFESLEVLWLNGNKLQAVTGLDDNFRITDLYLQNNRITTLEGSIELLTNLEVLNLAGNRIENLNRALECLSDCRRLKVLDLHGNPVAEEDHYRVRVVARLPSVEVLNRHRVTAKEREQAKKMRRSSSSASVALTASTSSITANDANAATATSAADSGDNDSEKAALLASALQKLRKRMEEKRIDLEPEWRAQDARRLGAVAEQELLRVLRLYSLDCLLNEQELIALHRQFVKDVRIPTSFYEARPRIKRMFDYASFCRRLRHANLDDEARRQQDKADTHLSATVRDLKAFVTRVNLRESREAAKLPPRAMTADPTMLMAKSTATTLRSTWRSQSNPGDGHDSRPWEVLECRQLLDRACGGNRSTVVTEQQLEEFARLMTESGRKLDISQLRQCAGEPLTKGKIVDALHDRSVWRLLTPDEASATRDVLFERAQTALRRLSEQQSRALATSEQQALQQQLRDSLTFGYRVHGMADRSSALQQTQFKSTSAGSAGGKARQRRHRSSLPHRGDYFVLQRPVTTGSSATGSPGGRHQGGHMLVSSQVLRIC